MQEVSQDNLTIFGRNMTMWMLTHELDTDGIRLHFRNNRLDTIVKLAYMHAIDKKTREHIASGSEVYACTTVDVTQLKITINFDGYISGNTFENKPIDQHPMMILLNIMETAKIDKEDIEYARARYNSQMISYNSEERDRVGKGIATLLEMKPMVHQSTIDEQFKILEEQMQNNLVARTWGFEIEIPDCKGVEAPNGIEKGDDGSLRSYEGSDDCECDCDDCSYHDCDCDWCDNRNTDPDHCGNSACASCESAEYRSTGGIQRMEHAGMFKLCADLKEKDAELNDSAGTHIHVYAQDLTTHQVGQVMAVYTWLDTILRPIAGRKNVNYAREVSVRYIKAALRKNDPRIPTEKSLEVNTMHLFNGRGTIEFRQMDCNANAKRITAWAWIVRGLVTASKRGATITDYTKCKDLNDVVAVLKKFNVEPGNEHPEQLIFGSKNDKDLVAPMLVTHKQYMTP